MSFHSKLSLGGIGRNFPELKKLWNNQKQLHSKRFAMKKYSKTFSCADPDWNVDCTVSLEDQ